LIDGTVALGPDPSPVVLEDGFERPGCAIERESGGESHNDENGRSKSSGQYS
jgi:hypothetical protein